VGVRNPFTPRVAMWTSLVPRRIILRRCGNTIVGTGNGIAT